MSAQLSSIYLFEGHKQDARCELCSVPALPGQLLCIACSEMILRLDRILRPDLDAPEVRCPAAQTESGHVLFRFNEKSRITPRWF
jgi:hypothetical protein